MNMLRKSSNGEGRGLQPVPSLQPNQWALEAAEKLDTEGGGDFNPRIMLTGLQIIWSNWRTMKTRNLPKRRGSASSGTALAKKKFACETVETD
jgi:hypothetical protein